MSRPTKDQPPTRPGRFSAISHDLTSPLNAIIGFATLLAERGEDLPADRRERFASHIRDSGEALRSMLARLVSLLEGEKDVVSGWSSGTFQVGERESGTLQVAPQATPALSSIPAPHTAGRPVVLVVDQDDHNCELTSAFLSGRGYEILTAHSGQEALAVAQQRTLDLALLEARMPEMDGFEIASRLKALSEDEYLPVVFVTAMTDDESRLRALEVGAEQYLAKPVNRHELRARVKNLLNLRAHQRALAAQNAQLRSLERFKDETTAMLVHDLKSPLSAMTMNLEFALRELTLDPSLDPVRGALEDSRAAGSRLFRMIANLLDIGRGEEGRLVPRRASVDVNDLFERIRQMHAVEACARGVSLTTDLSVSDPLDGDPELLGRVTENLVENALRYTRAGGRVHLIARQHDRAFELSVANDGPRIEESARKLIFEKYAQGAQPPSVQGINRGLGLYFCRLAVEAHGGSITVEEEPGLPTSFRVTLPRR